VDRRWALSIVLLLLLLLLLGIALLWLLWVTLRVEVLILRLLGRLILLLMLMLLLLMSKSTSSWSLRQGTVKPTSPSASKTALLRRRPVEATWRTLIRQPWSTWRWHLFCRSGSILLCGLCGLLSLLRSVPLLVPPPRFVTDAAVW
jgi:hypothetical protein